jgi:hypothetical protein
MVKLLATLEDATEYYRLVEWEGKVCLQAAAKVEDSHKDFCPICGNTDNPAQEDDWVGVAWDCIDEADKMYLGKLLDALVAQATYIGVL